MISTSFPRRVLLVATLTTCVSFAVPGTAVHGLSEDDSKSPFAETFDAHWECMRDNYPYFELYGVDWEAERDDHRPRALAAANETEFAWEIARMLTALPDPHLSFVPSMNTIKDRWSSPELKTHFVERRLLVVSWPDGQAPQGPARFVEDPHAYPEIISISGTPAVGVAYILAAGPLGSELDVRLRWPDGTELDHTLQRSRESNIPPPPTHYGETWVVTGRVGAIGYLRVKTFNPTKGTLGPDGKMTTMLRAALKELAGTDAIILDLQGNGGGLVSASDPFLGHFLDRRLSYRWGNGGRSRVIRAQKPRYRGAVVTLVDSRSASGGEWAARILRDAGRAVVIGDRTSGAEAAVKTFNGPDGSVLKYSAWPMVERGRTPFQEVGIVLDHALPLTVTDVRTHGLTEAKKRVRRARFAKALEVLGGQEGDLDALILLANAADAPETEK